VPVLEGPLDVPLDVPYAPDDEPEAFALATNLSNVLPVSGALIAKTMPDWQWVL